MAAKAQAETTCMPYRRKGWLRMCLLCSLPYRVAAIRAILKQRPQFYMLHFNFASEFEMKRNNLDLAVIFRIYSSRLRRQPAGQVSRQAAQ
jgi:hypothetical protein